MKCGQYWPQGEEGEEQFEEFIVINTSMEQNREYSITGLHVHNTLVNTLRIFHLDLQVRNRLHIHSTLVNTLRIFHLDLQVRNSLHVHSTLANTLRIFHLDPQVRNRNIRRCAEKKNPNSTYIFYGIMPL